MKNEYYLQKIDFFFINRYFLLFYSVLGNSAARILYIFFTFFYVSLKLAICKKKIKKKKHSKGYEQEYAEIAVLIL